MQTIGRYQLVEKLGQGGMGVVYRAFDPLLQRVVAVKLIGAIEADAAVKERFFREARAAGQLAHKNIITIYDMGEHEGQPFLAMEFLEGQDLQQRMAAQVPMTLARKLELATELCEGIEYAHNHGVIHRDIKPANIFLTATGATKILDFGLARLITSELTNSNMMMGTLNYMAPEQVRGERADHRSDIFSTGVVLYELFGGRKAFEGDSFGATLYKILEEIPEPLLNLDATLPPAVIAIIERALEKTRDDRYPTMGEMLRDLSLYRQQYVLSNTPPLGGAPTEVTRVPSDVPRRSSSVPLSPASGGTPPMLAHDAPTMATPTPVPAGSPGSGNLPAPAMSSNPGTAPPAPSSSRKRTLIATAIGASALVVVLAIWGIGQNSQNTGESVSNAAAARSAEETQQAIASRLEQASKALQAGDQAEAQRQADAVLAISPGHPEARALRDRAQHAADTVSRGLASAKELIAAGRFEEASRAAGEVLSVDPGNEEAKRLADDAAARSRGRGVEEARQRMTSARNAAVASAAGKLAAAPYGAAVAAEREAQRLYKDGKMAEAVVKFAEATGLFRSAEIAANTEAAARKERARAEAVTPAPAPAEPAKPPESKPDAAAVPLPTTPVPPVSGAGTLPKSSTVAPPQPPPAAPAPPTAKPTPVEPEKPTPSPNALIMDVVEQYESALEARDLAALKRVWPSLSGSQEAAIRSDFTNSRRIVVEVVSPQITVRDDTATVRFLRRYTFDSVEGQTYYSQSNTTMTLQRNGNAWAITQIQYVPVR